MTTAQNLLLDLSGSVSGASLTINVNSSTEQVFQPVTRVKDYHQNEWGAFFKDDWKIRPDLTLNVGLRYDFYGVPWEKNGLNVTTARGSAGLFGISDRALRTCGNPGARRGNRRYCSWWAKTRIIRTRCCFDNDWHNIWPRNRSELVSAMGR